jgi:hypothetical protein
MSHALVTVLQWYGAIAGAIAALIVSLDLGRKPTGYGFVIFVTSSIALILWGFMSEEGEPRSAAPRRIASATSRAASCSRATGSGGCSIPARPSSRSASSPPATCTKDEAPGAGMIAGIGRVSGRETMIVFATTPR